jgi:hypothetical protein
MGETFPEGTSQSDPSAVPPLDPETLEDEPEESEEGSVEEEPESQQTG